MSLVAMAISDLCSNINNIDKNACEKFLEASSKQTYIYQYDESAENTIKSMGQAKANATFNKTEMEIGGGIYYVYQSAKDKSVTFKLPKNDFCNDISNKITPNSLTVTFKWNLW